MMLQDGTTQVGKPFLHREVAVVDGGIDMAHHTVVAHQETIEQTIPIAQEGVVGTVEASGL